MRHDRDDRGRRRSSTAPTAARSIRSTRSANRGVTSMSEKENSRPTGAIAQCVVGSTERFRPREIWDEGFVPPILSEALSRVDIRPHHTSTPYFTQLRNVRNSVNRGSGLNTDRGESERRSLVTDGRERLSDGTSQDRAQTETAPWIVALGAVLGLAMLFVAIQGGAL